MTSPTSTAKPVPFPAWLGWTALVAAAAFALIAFTLRVGQKQLLSRARLAEQEARLAKAELQAMSNQLEAERILAAAQARLLREATRPADAPAAP